MYHKYVSQICITRAIAQLGRAPRLHVRQCFFRGVHHAIKRIYLMDKSMSYSTTLMEHENNSLTNGSNGLVRFGCSFRCQSNRTHH